MRSIKYSFFLSAAIGAATIISGCQSAANTNTAANKPANQRTSNMDANIPDAVPPQAPKTSAVGSLATPTEAYKTAFELRKNKDAAGLKKIMSNDVLDFLTEMGAAEKKTLDEMLIDMANKPQADKADVRNEKINGDRAELEYLTEKGDWKTMDFEKEGGEWKMSFPEGAMADTGPKKKP